MWKHRQTAAQKQIARNKRVEGDHKGAEKVIYRKKVVCRPTHSSARCMVDVEDVFIDICGMLGCSID